MNVSVVTPCFNQGRFLERCVRSVAEQDRPVVEHVIVNDGSTDGSLDVARELAGEYAHVRVLDVTSRGMANATNAGLLAAAPTEWVAVVCADDWVAPGYTAALLAAGAESAAAVVGAISRHRDGAPPEDPSLPVLLHPTFEELWEECVTHFCAMFRREVLIEVGGFHGLMSGDFDWQMWLEIAARGYEVAYAADAVYHYRIHGEQWTRREARALRGDLVAEMRRHFAGRLVAA